MCGICGILYTEPDQRVDENALIQMRDLLTHRGPDDAGIYINQNIGIASRRLSIIDLEGGHQPILNEDGTACIVYNGEIYNYLELRGQLISKGHTFKTRSDTEVILHAYEEFGKDCLARLRGMFAFAIWDNKKRELFAARDRLGVKPLYYHRSNDCLLFASEIKSILKFIKPEFNLKILPEYLANRFVTGESTFFNNIKKLLPGYYLVWKGNDMTIAKYWDLAFDGSAGCNSETEIAHKFYELFSESVKLRLMSDVPLGVFLSGGIDSSSITAVMSRLVSEPINSFSVAFKEREANELNYAHIAAKSFGTNHREIIVSREMFFEKLPKLIWHEDEPIAFASSIPLHFVSQLANDNHVKVVLTGEGSDELLAGYDKYIKTIYNIKFGRFYRKAFPVFLTKAVKNAIEGMSYGSKLKNKLIRTFLYLDTNIEEIYFDNFSVFTKAMTADLLNKKDHAIFAEIDPYGGLKAYFDKYHNLDLLDRMLYTDIKTYLERLLMKQDKMSMAASIESRVPFLDHRLVEFIAGLPVSVKLRGWTTKYILIKAMEHILPKTIIHRSKWGFPVPIKKWFREYMSPELEDYLTGKRAMERGYFSMAYVRKLLQEHKEGVMDHSERIWLLLNLEIWHRIFIDGEGRT